MPELTAKRKLILALFFLTFLIMIFGVSPWQDLGIPLPQLNWWFAEFTALFLGAGILIVIQSAGHISCWSPCPKKRPEQSKPF